MYNCHCRILHCDGFSREDLMQRKLLVYSNVISAMGTLCQAMSQFGMLYANLDYEVLYDCLTDRVTDGLTDRLIY